MPTLPLQNCVLLNYWEKCFSSVKEQTPRPRKKSANFFATINFPYTVIVYNHITKYRKLIRTIEDKEISLFDLFYQ